MVMPVKGTIWAEEKRAEPVTVMAESLAAAFWVCCPWGGEADCGVAETSQEPHSSTMKAIATIAVALTNWHELTIGVLAATEREFLGHLMDSYSYMNSYSTVTDFARLRG
jgi:hypothetical protein